MSISSDEAEALITTTRISNYSSTKSESSTQIRRQHEESRLKLAHGEHTPAYDVLKSQNLLITAFRKERFSDVFEEDDLNPNSSISANFGKKWRWGVYWTPGCGWMVYVSWFIQCIQCIQCMQCIQCIQCIQPSEFIMNENFNLTSVCLPNQYRHCLIKK